MTRTIDLELVDCRMRLRNPEQFGTVAPMIEFAAGLTWLICEFPEESLRIASLGALTGVCLFLARGSKKYRA